MVVVLGLIDIYYIPNIGEVYPLSMIYRLPNFQLHYTLSGYMVLSGLYPYITDQRIQYGWTMLVKLDINEGPYSQSLLK